MAIVDDVDDDVARPADLADDVANDVDDDVSNYDVAADTIVDVALTCHD